MWCTRSGLESVKSFQRRRASLFHDLNMIGNIFLLILL